MSLKAMKRREVLKMAAVVGWAWNAAARTAAPQPAANPGDQSQMATATEPQSDGAAFRWFDAREWGVEGKGWEETEAYFDRLPARARGVVRDAVWNLSRHSAGMCFQFESDAPEIRARWKVSSSSLAMVHMPATGASGLDLYAETGDGTLRWVAVGRPTGTENEAVLASGLLPGRRAYRVYLPLYNRTEWVQVGVPAGAHFQPVAPRRQPPIAFYGTSIVHGGCASRPGMAHPAILGRRLNCPVLNLGFSGNGQMEPEVAEFLAELDPRVYVVDCLPNMQAELVAARTEPLVRILRKARPRTPIVLVEDRTYANALLIPANRARNEASRAALRKAYQRLVDDGVTGLHYLPGENLLGDDGEATVDGSHPTDLGFARMADAMEPLLRRLCAA